MSPLTEALLYLFGAVTFEPEVCTRSIDHLTVQKKIEFSIGCSYVNGRRVYSDQRLKWIAGFSDENHSDINNNVDE